MSHRKILNRIFDIWWLAKLFIQKNLKYNHDTKSIPTVSPRKCHNEPRNHLFSIWNPGFSPLLSDPLVSALFRLFFALYHVTTCPSWRHIRFWRTSCGSHLDSSHGHLYRTDSVLVRPATIEFPPLKTGPTGSTPEADMTSTWAGCDVVESKEELEKSWDQRIWQERRETWISNWKKVVSRFIVAFSWTHCWYTFCIVVVL